MAIQSPSSSSSSSSSSCSVSNDFTYHVFISFRGTDTRFGFTGNLYNALCDKGIRTFIDDKELQRGDEITPSLLNNIEDSRIAIIVFSKDYASSSFCLDELVHIIHYFKAKDRLVLPVFYGVEPSQVRHHNDMYGEALAKYEESFQNNKENMERLRRWKMALNQAANLSGYHFNLRKEEYEYMFIKNIVTDISNKINRVLLHVADHPVGLESRLLQVKSLVDVDCDNGICMIGIYGSGGLGKTTLSRAIYNLIADQFEGLCFLHNVRENSIKHGLEYLQEQLLFKSIGLEVKLGHVSEGIPIIKQRLEQKKVLLILDDVDRLMQLQVLVGKPSWFGLGSRVIVTTRDKNLLSCHGIKTIYEAGGLIDEEALELLKMMTFKSNKNDSSYDYILNRAVKYSSGLPLALEVVGSNLFGKSVAECESTLDKYERIPHEDIQKILKVSFDALDEEQQSVFLDIACFFKGCQQDYVQVVLHDHYGHCIKSHLRVLVDRSLIKFCTHEFRKFYVVRLHDLIEDMGKEIVRQESRKELGERSRLWCRDDIVHVLKENTGTSKVEMIYLNCYSMETIEDWNRKAFKKMKKLKTLIFEDYHFSKGPKYLPSSLRVLNLTGYPSKSLSTCFSYKKKFENMKVFKLFDCEYLTHIPNVSGLPNLVNISFEKCHNLITIDTSIGYLNKLEILNAKECIKLESFPPLRLTSLIILALSGCKSLKSFPELLCEMKNIKEIWLDHTSIKELPFSFQNLSKLCHLELWRCPMLRFPKHNEKMYSVVFSNVTELSLQDCNLSDECLQIVLKWCANLTCLELSGNNLKILPECLSECYLLKNLNLNYCNYLEEIRGIPPNLDYLDVVGSYSLSSSSRRMLLSQKLHDTGCTDIRFPNGTEGIPDWFEHKIRGLTISFWFRKKIPFVTSIIIVPNVSWAKLKVNYFVNGYECTLSDEIRLKIPFIIAEHTYLFNLQLEEDIKRCKMIHGNLVSEMDKALSKNEWIHVELKLEDDWIFHLSAEEKIKILRSAEMGIHVLKEKSNTGADVIFTDPYSRKRKSYQYLKASLSQKKKKQSKFSILMEFQRKMWVHHKLLEEEKRKMRARFLGLG